MNIWNFDVIELWILLGTGIIILEMFALPGLGLLFVGLGTLTLAALMSTFPEIQEFQYIFLAILSVVWFTLLWQPLKRYVYDTSEKDQFSDMIGNDVVVHNNDLIPGMIGEVMWSGTIMNAKLDDSMTEKAIIGQKLEVKRIHGNVVICGLPNPLKVKKNQKNAF